MTQLECPICGADTDSDGEPWSEKDNPERSLAGHMSSIGDNGHGGISYPKAKMMLTNGTDEKQGGGNYKGGGSQKAVDQQPSSSNDTAELSNTAVDTNTNTNSNDASTNSSMKAGANAGANPTMPAGDADSSSSSSDETELPCGHESYERGSAPAPPFRVSCSTCGDTWRVSE
jgi:Tfp pilus assembly major pilin PilA